MLFEFNIYSSLLLVFFVHITVYAIMLWRRGIKQESTADKFMGSFLLLAALYVIPWMVGFAGWYDNQPYRDILFYTPFILGLFIGPVLFLYVKAIIDIHKRKFPSYREKAMWLNLVIAAPLMGAIFYFALKKQRPAISRI